MLDFDNDERPWKRHYMTSQTRDAPAPRPLWTWLDDAACRFPDRPHLQFRARVWTFAETAELVGRLAGGLQAAGIEIGDRVGLCMPNHPAYPLLCYALWRLGAVGVALNPLYSTRQLIRNASDAGVKLIVSTDDEARVSDAATLAAEVGCRLILCRADAADLDRDARDQSSAVSVSDCERMSHLLAGPRRAGRPVAADALAMIQYTGGTSGAPKGAMVSHGNIWHATHQMRNWQHRLRDGSEAWYAAAPVTHIAGLIHFVALPALVAGKVLLVERFSVDELVALAGAGEVTMLTAVPTMLNAIAQHPASTSVDWSGVSHVMGGGASLAPDIGRAFHAVTGLHVQMGYAMTETTCGGAAMPADGIPGHETAAGVPIPGMQIEIRKIGSSGDRVAFGQTGEICLAGPAVISGYWGRGFTQDEVTPDGLFRSGDLGRITEDGVLYVIDRLKDVIICSGYKVYPGNVENAVLEHPAVIEAVVVGMPDPYRGETVVAVVVLREGQTLSEAELAAFLTQHLSAMEAPKRLVIMNALPKTENGKLSRHLVRRALAQSS